MGLELAAGDAGADAPVRWVHVSELADPTPWLSGGELLLTTGMQLEDAGAPPRAGAAAARLPPRGARLRHRLQLRRACPPSWSRRPRSSTSRCSRSPTRPPFIALTEKAFARLVNEQYEVLQRGIATHKKLERLVVEERGLDEVVRALSAAIGGAVLVLDPRGEPLASRAFRRELAEEAVDAVRRAGAGRRTANEFAPDHPDSGRPEPGPAGLRAGPPARRRPGWWWCATPTASATSSGSSASRPPPWWPSSSCASARCATPSAGSPAT